MQAESAKRICIRNQFLRSNFAREVFNPEKAIPIPALGVP